MIERSGEDEKDIVDNNGYNPLFYVYSISKCLQLLLENGYDINKLYTYNDRHEKHTILQDAIYQANNYYDYNMIYSLLDNCKIDLNIQDSLGDTGLHKACKNGHLEVIDFLINNNADTTLLQKSKLPPRNLIR